MFWQFRWSDGRKTILLILDIILFSTVPVLIEIPLGTEFIMRKEVKSKVIDFRAVNERICILRINAKFFNMTYVKCTCSY
jgi:hypothetical protein